MRDEELITGLWGRCACCRRHVNEHTLRYWYSDADSPLMLCYPCFDERRAALSVLPPEHDAYMREILAHEQ